MTLPILMKPGTINSAPVSTLAGFVTFVGALVEAFGRYLDDEASEPAFDPVGYRQAALWLTDTETTDLVESLVAVIEPYQVNKRSPERRRILLNSIVIPDASA